MEYVLYFTEGQPAVVQIYSLKICGYFSVLDKVTCSQGSES
jgi:hypothetical protein